MPDDNLVTCTRKELTLLARRHRVGGWHSMKKAELIQAIRDARARRADERASGIRRQKLAAAADVGTAALAADRLVAEAVDSHWLHARWEIGWRGIRRAQAALKSDWHQSIPVLRLFDVTPNAGASATRRLTEQIDIHTETDRWFVPVSNAPRDYELEIGYRTPRGRFHLLARSRRVRTAPPNSRVTTEPENTRSRPVPFGKPISSAIAPVRRPIGGHGSHRGIAAGTMASGSHPFEFSLDAELVVHGVTHPHAETTLLGQPVQPDRDGAFTMRLSLPEGRQIIPAVATAPDSTERRTIVLMIERNTRELEPQPLDEEW